MADRRRGVITLTTDFGLADPYVAAMKGVILSINPAATIVDVSHEVRPQSLLQATFVTQSVWSYFPDGTVHVAVVDPGVGTERRALVVVSPRALFVGPDNGVLSAALPDVARCAGDGQGEVPLPAGYRAFSISNRAYMREPVSDTFHGRDVFAPAAGHLSVGVSPDALGAPVESLIAFPPLRARRRPDGALDARVVHIDRFGNIVTDARREDLPDGPLTVEAGGETIEGPVRTYAQATGLAALVGSAGYLELALPGGSAAEALGLNIGDPVVIRARSS